MGFGEELPNSVCGDGERDSRRHLQGIYTDYISVLTQLQTVALSGADDARGDGVLEGEWASHRHHKLTGTQLNEASRQRASLSLSPATRCLGTTDDSRSNVRRQTLGYVRPSLPHTGPEEAHTQVLPSFLGMESHSSPSPQGRPLLSPQASPSPDAQTTQQPHPSAARP
ncbi:hypothetical protein EYF80_020662 [Liparis tanakae]|uniref:Uncharacterized protein n=1 Tax=Liparis tanakae TaxID=230148 RepID=A0A4Z2HTE7_9TELE|nr:hypothetical protein EYF80_020662 [Liparis tanakae]